MVHKANSHLDTIHINDKVPSYFFTLSSGSFSFALGINLEKIQAMGQNEMRDIIIELDPNVYISAANETDARATNFAVGVEVTNPKRGIRATFASNIERHWMWDLQIHKSI